MADTGPSEVDKNTIPRINFLIVDETVEHSYEVVARRRQGITGGGIFRAEETLDAFF